MPRVEPTDLVIIVPGIMGSSLTRNGRVLWDATPTTVARVLADPDAWERAISLPVDWDGDEDGGDIRPGRLIGATFGVPGLWALSFGYADLARQLESSLQALRSRPGVLPFPYDWRLSNRRSAAELARFTRKHLERWRQATGWSDARATLVCHSMGGLVGDYFVKKLGGHEVVRKLVTYGTPFDGSLKALRALDPATSSHGGSVRRRLARVAKTFPSMAELLPQYPFADDGSDTRTLPEAPSAAVDDRAMSWAEGFHADLRSSIPDRSTDHHAVVGIFQRTPTYANLVDGGDVDGDGDGTVPRESATPKGWRSDDPAIHFIVDTHGGLPSNRSLHDEVLGIVTSVPVQRRGLESRVGVEVAEVARVGERHTIRATVSLPGEAIEVRIAREGEVPLHALMRQVDDKILQCDVTLTSLGTYVVEVAERRPAGVPLDRPVRFPLLAVDEGWEK